MFSLSGKSKNQIPCFPCAVATLIILERWYLLTVKWKQKTAELTNRIILTVRWKIMSRRVLLRLSKEQLPPANVVCEGYVFTGVCLSTRGVSRPTPKGEVEGDQAGGGSLGPHPRGKLRGIWPRGVSRRPHTRGGVCSAGACLRGCVEPPRDGYCCGWYVSYWNAFLFWLCAHANKVFPNWLNNDNLQGCPSLSHSTVGSPCLSPLIFVQWNQW